MIVFTDHAVQRYIERVAPGRDDSSARHDLELLRRLGTVDQDAPAWANGYPHVWWLHVGGTLAFPLRRHCYHLVAVTCLTRRAAPSALRARAVSAERERIAA